MFLEGVLTVSVWTFIWVWVCVCVCVCVTVCASLCAERVVSVSLCGHPWRDWGTYGCVWRKGCVGAGRNRYICVEMAVCVWMERQMTVYIWVLAERLGDCLWREGWGVCVCVFGETSVCMWMERSVFVCMWRDGRCVERGVFVGVFVEKQEVSGGRDRGVSECIWRE